MSNRAVLGKMSLCYVKTSNFDIGCIINNSKAKIVCINDSKVSNSDMCKNEDDALESQVGKMNIYCQLQEVFSSKFGVKSRFEKT